MLVNPKFDPKMDPKLEDRKLDASAIPDLERLLDEVLKFLQYINTDEMQKMELADPNGFEQHLDAKFTFLSLDHYSIFKMLLDRENREDNVCKLIEVFTVLRRVKTGELDIGRADDEFREEMNEKYLYAKFGGKEQFEKEMAKEEAKKGNKKKKK